MCDIILIFQINLKCNKTKKIIKIPAVIKNETITKKLDTNIAVKKV